MRLLSSLTVFALLLGVTLPAVSSADNPHPLSGTLITKTAHSYSALVDKLLAAVA